MRLKKATFNLIYDVLIKNVPLIVNPMLCFCCSYKLASGQPYTALASVSPGYIRNP
jgi:hypothetical protein